jgi:acetyl esterase/lipase
MCVLLSGCSSALDPLNVLTPGSAYDHQADIAYGDDPRQRMDLYRSRKPVENASTVVFVYGGAWRKGRREDYKFIAQSLASRGHDVLIPDYRLYPNVTWPDFIDDIADAIRLLDARSPEWLERPLGRIVLMGHSSGAHTASVLAGNPERWLSGVNAELVGLVGISGPYDLPLEDDEVSPVFAGLSDPDSAIPVNSARPSHPPTLLVHGTDDRRVLPFHTDNMARALEQLDVMVDVILLEGTGHGIAIANFALPLDLFSDAPERVGAWLAALDKSTTE